MPVLNKIYFAFFQVHHLLLRISMSLRQPETISLLHGKLQKEMGEVQSLDTTLSSVRLGQKSG